MNLAEVLPALEPIPARFYRRDPAEVAPDLLGAWLVSRTPEGPAAGVIVEVEAYRGRDDPASHAYRGPTARAGTMYGDPGRAYVYFTYGNHHCLNAVAHGPGQAGAVLIRALEPRMGLELMRRRRGGRPDHQLTSGPGKLCRALGIDLSANGEPLCGPWLWLCRPHGRPPTGSPAVGPRVGIRRAAEAPLRFYLEGNPYVSPGRPPP